MDSLCFISTSFCHSLGCASRRRCQPDFQTFQLKIFDYCINSCSLTSSRTASNNNKPVSYCFRNSLFLDIIKNYSFLILNPCNPVINEFLIFLNLDIKIIKHSCNICFHIVIHAGIDTFYIVLNLNNYLLIHCQVHKVFVIVLDINQKKFVDLTHKLIIRKICVSLHCRLVKHIKYSALNPEFRINLDSGTRSNLISSPKTDTLYVISKPVRILFKNVINIVSITLKYFVGKIHLDSITLKKHHCFSDVFLVNKLVCYIHSFRHAYSFNLSQTLRFFFHNPECIIAKCLNYSFSHLLADTLDCPGA